MYTRLCEHSEQAMCVSAKQSLTKTYYNLPEMKKLFRFLKNFLILPLLLPLLTKAQTIPIGMPVLAEAYRRGSCWENTMPLTALLPCHSFLWKPLKCKTVTTLTAPSQLPAKQNLTAFLPSEKTEENFSCCRLFGKISLTAFILPVTTMASWCLQKAIRPISAQGFMQNMARFPFSFGRKCFMSKINRLMASNKFIINLLLREVLTCRNVSAIRF